MTAAGGASPGVVALICGTGRLPAILAERLVAKGTPPILLPFGGAGAPLPDLPVQPLRLERLAGTLTTLRALGVTRLCMAGAASRPALDPALADAATQPLLSRIAAAMARGDDGTLRALAAIVEEAGIEVIGPADIAADLLAAPGQLVGAPPEGLARMVAMGRAAVAEMGAADQGQACLVGPAGVIAREGPDGTDALIAGHRTDAPRGPAPEPLSWAADLAWDALGGASDWLSGGARPSGAILWKAPKPDQDRRLDLPAIGPGTVDACARAGLSGIAIEAGGVLVLDRAEVLSACARAGLSLSAHG
ncbi:MAG: LpxI family protein [Paracoccaceae bacterium]